MAAKVELKFNRAFFDQIMLTGKVDALLRQTALKALQVARSSAPVKSGAYKSSLHIEKRRSKYRTVYRVVGSDRKTMIIEARTGNLARALKAVKKS